jgi:hypothetical protein
MIIGTSSSERRQRVHIYGEMMTPAPNTHGAGLVLCSQVQAFLDLGCDVEFVYLQTRDGFFTTTCDYFKQLTYTVLDARTEKTSKYTRLAYLAGWPEDASWRQLYPARELLQREVQKRIDNDRTGFTCSITCEPRTLFPVCPTCGRSGPAMRLSRSSMR